MFKPSSVLDVVNYRKRVLAAKLVWPRIVRDFHEVIGDAMIHLDEGEMFSSESFHEVNLGLPK
jgi:hypothetical protein